MHAPSAQVSISKLSSRRSKSAISQRPTSEMQASNPELQAGALAMQTKELRNPIQTKAGPRSNADEGSSEIQYRRRQIRDPMQTRPNPRSNANDGRSKIQCRRRKALPGQVRPPLRKRQRRRQLPQCNTPQCHSSKPPKERPLWRWANWPEMLVNKHGRV